MMDKEAPVICAECDRVDIRDSHLYCRAINRKIYGSKPDWCPYPLWIKEEDDMEGQMNIFDFLKENNEKDNSKS